MCTRFEKLRCSHHQVSSLITSIYCYKPTENAPLYLELLWMYYDNNDDDDGTFPCFYCFLVSYVISLYFQYSIQKLFVLKEACYVREM